jgi:hypothetical protein
MTLEYDILYNKLYEIDRDYIIKKRTYWEKVIGIGG